MTKVIKESNNDTVTYIEETQLNVLGKLKNKPSRMQTYKHLMRIKHLTSKSRCLRLQKVH